MHTWPYCTKFPWWVLTTPRSCILSRPAWLIFPAGYMLRAFSNAHVMHLQAHLTMVRTTCSSNIAGPVGRPLRTMRDEFLLAPVAGQPDAWSLGMGHGSDEYFVDEGGAIQASITAWLDSCHQVPSWNYNQCPLVVTGLIKVRCSAPKLAVVASCALT